MRSTLAVVLLSASLTACDCDGGRFREVVQDPAAAVTPLAIDRGHLCAPVDDQVTVRNDGAAELIISSLTLDGSGWALVAPPSIPARLEPGASLLVVLHATSGAATLQLETNDPKQPRIDVPLAATANTPPTLSITSPTAGAVVDGAADLELSARVGDDFGPARGLFVRWSSPAAGELVGAPPGDDGVVRARWPAAGRPNGPQELTVEVVDSCGAKTSAPIKLCFDGTYTYEPFHLDGWTYNGSARYDAAQGYLLLTPALQSQSGSAFELSQSVGAGSVDIEFGFFMGLGTGADGFSLTALDKTRMTTTVGPQGCGIGYGGGVSCTSGAPLPGWSVEVDTHYNQQVDPTPQPHVAFTFDGALVNQPLWAVLPKLDDAQWHKMRVQVTEPRVRVTIDDVTYLDGDVQGRFDFPAYLGFTAATGGYTNEHRIRALEVTGRYCDPPASP